jgi:hypothetical protein
MSKLMIAPKGENLTLQDSQYRAQLEQACDQHLADLRRGETRLASLNLREAVPHYGACVRRALP